MVKELFLKIKHKKILEEMEKIEISEKALENYRMCVRNNIFKSDEVLKNKLKRNFVLGEKVDYRTIRYGNLHIYFEGNLIKSIYNVKGGLDELTVDNKLKNELNLVLGI